MATLTGVAAKTANEKDEMTMLESRTKEISLDGQIYEMGLSYDLNDFSAFSSSGMVTDAATLAELFSLNRAILFSESVLDFRKGALLSAISDAKIALQYIDIVEHLEDTYEKTISGAGIVVNVLSAYRGHQTRLETAAEITPILLEFFTGMAARDIEASVFHMLVDSTLAGADEASQRAYSTYLTASRTAEVLSAGEIRAMAIDASQAAAMSTEVSLLISSYDFQIENPWITIPTDLALEIGSTLFEGWVRGETPNAAQSISPNWELAVKSANFLSTALGLVDFSVEAVDIAHDFAELLQESVGYYDAQAPDFLSPATIDAFKTGFEAITYTPADTSDDYVDPNPRDDHGDNATTISLGPVNSFTSLEGNIGTRNDNDVYEVTLTASQKIAILLWANSTENSGLDPFVSVQFPNGTIVTNDDLSSSSLTSFLTFIAPASGIYSITASGVGSTTGEYLMSVTPLETDDAAGDLTEENNPATDGGNTSGWHWEGTPDDDNPGTLTLEAGGAPDVDDDNRYRGHDGDDDIEAGRGDDVVWGDDGDDDLDGEDGDDTIRGGEDDDTIRGGDDDDLIYGEDGSDRIFGDTSSTTDNGDDTIYGGDGEDDIKGGRGNDYIKGEDDNDEIRGNDGNDELYGDRGDDELDGDDGNDLIFGGRGDDDVEGDDGHDRLAGEDGNDTLEGGDGDDELYGGDDDDFLQGGSGNDLLHGEDGNDTADFSDGNDGIVANLFDEIATSADLGTDILYDIENLIGSDGNDVVDGNHEANSLSGLDGDDAIRGHNGNDTLFGGDEDDILWGDQGDDTVHGEDNDDELRGGLGNDLLNGGSGDDHLRGEQDNDTIDGGTGTDTVFFWGELDDFDVAQLSPGVIRVADLRTDGLEGVDTLTNVEFIEFFDRTVSVADLFAPAPSAITDFAETTADRVISVDAVANDQSNASTSWISSATVVDGMGTASVIGGSVIYDPDGQFEYLAGDESETVNISYILETSGGQSVNGSISLEVSGTELTDEPTVPIDEEMPDGPVQEPPNADDPTVAPGFLTISVPNLLELSQEEYLELAELYVAYFNRAADVTGLAFWADAYGGGMSLARIAEYFFDQDEVRALYPDGQDTDAFISDVYQNVFGRTPDAAGFAFWKDVLDKGAVTIGSFVQEVLAGAKSNALQADAEYIGLKANLGLYFATGNGLSDVPSAITVLSVFGPQSASDFEAAIDYIEALPDDPIPGVTPEVLQALADYVDTSSFVTDTDTEDAVMPRTDLDAGLIADSELTLDLSASSTSNVVSLIAQHQDFISGDAANYDLLNYQHIIGGSQSDQITGNSSANNLSGGAGDDRLFGLSGDDVMKGDDGADFLNGGPGDDILEGGSGADTFLVGGGSTGHDRIVDFVSNEDGIYYVISESFGTSVVAGIVGEDTKLSIVGDSSTSITIVGQVVDINDINLQTEMF